VWSSGTAGRQVGVNSAGAQVPDAGSIGLNVAIPRTATVVVGGQ
jgi:hypothetical protein